MDVLAATAIAVVAIFLVAIFNLSPLLFIVIFFALCAYIGAQTAARQKPSSHGSIV
jgi:hypothetical protein